MHTIQQLRSGELSNSTYIKISENLTVFPEELYRYTDTLEVLDLSGNALDSLPNDFIRFSNLRILFLSNNKFEILPSILGALPNLDIIGFKANQINDVPELSLPASLRWLILTDNKIKELPRSIGLCLKLQKVMLAGNDLHALPIEMALCRNIELLRISANKIKELPLWLMSLPKLAWFAFAGNPCSFQSDERKKKTNIIHWDSITIKEQLGEGASGVIYKAALKDSVLDVAVKIFKGAVTSDGLPIDEMRACIQAGLHYNLVPVKAIITHHPDHKEGLVMDLIPSNYSNLGLPPNFVTCTRDTFLLHQVFSIDEIIYIARGIAEVTIQLHDKGIMHGDLYAHNILVNAEYHALLGDFGAATIFSIHDLNVASCFEKIEVRAYGCLLEDLLDRVLTHQESEKEYLVSLKNECVLENMELRPTFKSILERLSKVFNK